MTNATRSWQTLPEENSPAAGPDCPPPPRQLSQPLTLEELAGEDPQMLRNIRCAHRIADTDVSVLIQGPTGSGKEAFAYAIHLASRRAHRPFIAVNCAAIPETLIESELFGYKPGAFTGARREGLRGRILQSSGGTLFLDEIGDMPLALQSRLLRVLEERQVVPLGSEAAIAVDLHVLAASHRNLREMIARGAFREDLYYRLNGITLELPALRERVDRERLIQHALAAETGNGRPAAVERDALQRLLAYAWPGNIRELRNVIRTALAICEGGVIRGMDLPREIREEPSRSDERPDRMSEPSETRAYEDGECPRSRAYEAADGVGTQTGIRNGKRAWIRTGERVPSPWTANGSAPSAADPTSSCPRDAAEPAAPVNRLQAAERAALLRAIEELHGNMSRVAAELGMSRNTLYRKIKRHGIAPLRRV